jgi:hypothetical protein
VSSGQDKFRIDPASDSFRGCEWKGNSWEVFENLLRCVLSGTVRLVRISFCFFDISSLRHLLKHAIFGLPLDAVILNTMNTVKENPMLHKMILHI